MLVVSDNSCLTLVIRLNLSQTPAQQSGALSLVGRVEIVLSLVESFIELKYFHHVALERKKKHSFGVILLASLVLYGIRDARKGPIVGGLYDIKNQFQFHVALDQ